MTQEEKELLIKDLCSRLQYGVQIYCEKGESKFNFTLYGISGKMLISKITYEEKTYSKGIVSKHYEYPIYSSFLKIICKPYLRPMSSMTEEEQEGFAKFHCVNICPMILTDMLTLDNESKMFDWLNKKGFDYRGLIPMGLALPATEDMYK